jgi:hypothetical protein
VLSRLGPRLYRDSFGVIQSEAFLVGLDNHYVHRFHCFPQTKCPTALERTIAVRCRRMGGTTKTKIGPNTSRYLTRRSYSSLSCSVLVAVPDDNEEPHHALCRRPSVAVGGGGARNGKCCCCCCTSRRAAGGKSAPLSRREYGKAEILFVLNECNV